MPAAVAGPSSHAVNGKANGHGHGHAPANQRVSKNAKRRAKKKQEKGDDEQHPPAPSSASVKAEDTSLSRRRSASPSTSSVAKPIINEFQADLPADDEAFKQFKEVFAKFQAPEDDSTNNDPSSSKGQVIYSDDGAMSDSDATDADRNDEEDAYDLSKRRQKKLARLTIAELKQIVKKPEVVDWSDVTATDPRLLVAMKSTRNTVPVPPHWSQKREYLQNKRGIEKPAYELPSYIADTGIGTMKDALREKEAEQSLKTKTRARVQPKMGQIGTDYQLLRDAFFRFQVKPPLSRYGETYYEGKEYEHKFKQRQPGDLSIELKEALSIPPLAPPPWLIAMQRFGPPPSYPHLMIPGLNAPIPEGAQWGFHPGGWGRPPMDEAGNPLYGDVMGYNQTTEQQFAAAAAETVEKDLFGELESEEEEEEEESDDEDEPESDQEQDEEEEEEEPATPSTSHAPRDGLETPGGLASVASTVPAGMATPDFLELRKQGLSTPSGTSGGMRDVRPDSSRSLYQVIPETQGSMQGFMGSERGYDLSTHSSSNVPVLGAEASRGTKRKAASTVEVSLDPAELERLSEEELQARYDQAQQAKQQRGMGTIDTSGEDLSLLREELTRKRKANEERRRGGR